MKPFFLFLTAFFITCTAGATPGLNAAYYEGDWNTLPNFSTLTPVKKGIVSNVDLGYRNRETLYAILWQGYLNVPSAGDYTFETVSDDGSKLYIGNYSSTAIPLINNEGVHAPQSRTATISLKAGLYPITMAYFQNGGGQTMDVYWSSNTGITKSLVPDDAFFTDAATIKVIPKTNAGMYYSYYEGNWSTMPDFGTLTAVKKGVTANFSLDLRNRESQYAFLWQGYIIIPATGVYTFETTSDDGTKLFVGDNNNSLRIIVDNDAVHYNQIRKGSVYLSAGVHAITMGYFQAEGGQMCEVYWSSNTGISRAIIPDSVLTTRNTVEKSSSTSVESKETAAINEVVGSGGLTGIHNYYFSTSTGDDNRSGAEAQNSNTPWKTLNKLNEVFPSLLPGDAVLFNRGEMFDGSINISKSGASGSPIILSCYGTGLKPVINALYKFSHWTSLGNNLWEIYCPTGDKVSMVTLNGMPQAMGRYPNITDTTGGYLTFESHDGITSITDSKLTAYPDWKGAEVVIRKRNWVLDRCLVTSQSGGTLYYNSTSDHEPVDGNGYFFQNSLQTLDQQGEWYYDPIKQRLHMYLVKNPDEYDIRASIIDTLVQITKQGYITLDNLNFTGADRDAVNIQANANDIHIQNCMFVNSGMMGVESLVCSGLTLENNLFQNTNNNAIDFQYCNHVIIRNNVIKNSGTLAGMGRSNNFNYEGISFFNADSTLIENNEIDSSGYCGLMFSGPNVTIKNNFINWFNLVKDDGGGIYTYGDLDKYNRVITGNIIMNGTGAAAGSSDKVSVGSNGIYLDDKSANVDVTNNTVTNCVNAGIYIHNAKNINVNGNTFFNNGVEVSIVHDEIARDVPITNLAVTNNIVFAKAATQPVISGQTLGDDMASFGTFNYNYYARPLNQSGVNSYKYKDGSGVNHFTNYDLEGWKTKFGFDPNSAPSPVTIPSFVVNSTIGENKYPSGSFDNNTGNVFCSSGPGSCSVSVNNGKLDGGTVQVSFNPANGQTINDDIATWIDFGPVQAGKTYVISFSLLGSQANKTLTSFILENGGSYSHLNSTIYFPMQNYRTENKFLFTAPITTNNAMIGFFTLGLEGTYWFDNLNVQEANVSLVNIDDHIRFEYNPTTVSKTVSLDATYIDVKNNSYSGNVTLAPYTSVVLIKETSSSAGTIANAAAVTEASKAPSDGAATEAAVAMHITPNPTSDKVQLFVSGLTGSKKASLAIHSISGATLKFMSLNASTQNVSFDVSAWSKGMYLVTITYDNGTVVSKKFVKN